MNILLAPTPHVEPANMAPNRVVRLEPSYGHSINRSPANKLILGVGSGVRIPGMLAFGASNVFYPSVARWSKTRSVIGQWAQLVDDWDGDDGLAPTVDQISAAKRFVTAAERRGVGDPRPFIASDGEIGFHWLGAAGKASVAFLRSDRFLAYCPRYQREPVQISGPLDIASTSAELLTALYSLR